MSTQPPTIRFYAIITDVGDRGGDVAVSWSAEPSASGGYTAKSLEDAGQKAGVIWARLMYGADQPPSDEGENKDP